MRVSTSRFGTMDIDESRVINFPAGLLGFGDLHNFALLQPQEDSAFYWLQSTDDPALAFVVADPSLFVPQYRVPVRKDQMESLGLESIDQAQVFVIVNKYGQHLTGNLQGPLVINVAAMTGQQLVLADGRWSTRHKLVELNELAQVASA